MPLHYSVPVFAVSLAVMLAGSVFLSRLMRRLRNWWKIPEQFLGFLTAFAADSPEIASAVVAMLSGDTHTGVGVVFGSNLFNIASLLGVSALVAGAVEMKRDPVVLQGTVGILMVGLAVALVLRGATGSVALGLMSGIMVPYAVLLVLPRERLKKIPAPRRFIAFLLSATGEAQNYERKAQEDARAAAHHQKHVRSDETNVETSMETEDLLARIFGTLLVIGLASFGLVRSTTWLTSGVIPHTLLGTLILAGLTGIPNLYTAVRLAKRGQGSALLTEALNSNSINILIGLTIPSLIFGGVQPHTMGGYLDMAVLLLMTIGVVVALAAGNGLTRKRAIGIIAAYLIFVGIRVHLAI